MKCKLIVLTGLLILALAGCREEPIGEEPAGEDPVPQYLVIEPETATNSIGKQVYASLFGSSLPEYLADINNDLAGDLKFSCWVDHHLQTDIWQASVTTLSDSVEIETGPYTEYIASYHIKHAYPGGNDSITVHYRENYNPDKAYPSNLKTDTLNTLYPVIHSAGDTLSARGNWSKGSFPLKYDNHSAGVMTDISTGTWREVSKKMIGIRFREGGNMRYGWIEISVSGYSISLHRFDCPEIEQPGGT